MPEETFSKTGHLALLVGPVLAGGENPPSVLETA